MSNSDLTSLLLALLLLIGAAQLLGALFVKMRQPKVIGEIAAGVLLGPAILGRLVVGGYPIGSAFAEITQRHAAVLDFVYWLGLLLLMFLSGAETRQLFTREERKEVSWLVLVGTGIPFLLGLALGPWLSGSSAGANSAGPLLAGPRGTKMSLVIVLAVAGA